MTSPYLDRPLLPLAVALPRLLAEIDAALATAGPHRDAKPPPASRADTRAAHAEANGAALDLTAA
jgi:hypothetical protein